jgi:hypothetical protein
MFRKILAVVWSKRFDPILHFINSCVKMISEHGTKYIYSDHRIWIILSFDAVVHYDDEIIFFQESTTCICRETPLQARMEPQLVVEYSVDGPLLSV